MECKIGISFLIEIYSDGNGVCKRFVFGPAYAKVLALLGLSMREPQFLRRAAAREAGDFWYHGGSIRGSHKTPWTSLQHGSEEFMGAFNWVHISPRLLMNNSSLGL